MIRRAYLAWLRHRLSRFSSDTHRSREIQRRELLRKIKRNANSDFGRAFRFESIRSAADFRNRVPILTYEDHHPYVSRVLNGETTALFDHDEAERTLLDSYRGARFPHAWLLSGPAHSRRTSSVTGKVEGISVGGVCRSQLLASMRDSSASAPSR